MDKENLNEEEYLKKHLSSIDNQKNNEVQKTESTSKVNTLTKDLEFFHYNVDELPCGIFYPKGSKFMIRAASVKEIQAYSMVDESNFYDVIEKINNILQNCARIKYPDGSVGSYLDIKDQDRIYLIFCIRELTFQAGNNLSVSHKCSCGEEVNIPLLRHNFKFYDINPKLEKYFSASTRSFIFNLKSGHTYEMTPPNIGIQRAFTDYILKETNEKRSPNMAFLKIIPFMLVGNNSISYEGIQAKLKEFEKLSNDDFQFLNSAVSMMTFGISELKKTCGCGEEVHTEMQFPNGISAIFVIHDAFDTFIKE